MEWITKKEIKERSTSAYEAFTVSIEKYEQPLKVAEEEFKKALKDNNFGVTNRWCGCCMHYGNEGGDGNCGECPLRDCASSICCPKFYKMNDVFNAWQDGKTSFADFQNAVRLLLCRLYQERDKLPKEEKKPCKEEKLEHGDYGANNGMPWIHIAGKTYWWNTPSPSENSNESFIRSRDGNIFTDLEALKEPLEEFTVFSCGASFTAKNRNHNVKISVDGGHFPHKDIPEIILNLRRLVATAKRKDC